MSVYPPGLSRRVAALLLASAFALPLVPRPAPGDAPSCDAVKQDYASKHDMMNSETLNFLLFDAADAGCEDLVEQFLADGAPIEARNRIGNTALIIAARSGRLNVVTLLLSRGAAVNYANLNGVTALLAAATKGRDDVVRALLGANADVTIADGHGVTPLIAAGFAGDAAVAELLIRAGANVQDVDTTGKGTIVYASARGSVPIVKLMLDSGIDVNKRYGNDLTALMWAAGYADDVQTADGIATVQLLLSKGAKLDLADNRGRTALMIAAERGHAEVIATLLAAGADRALRDKDGKTAIDLATIDGVKQALIR